MCQLGMTAYSVGVFPDPDPEVLLAKAFKDDLGVDVNPMALRMFIRSRWSRVSTLAHKIHGTADATCPECSLRASEAA